MTYDEAIEYINCHTWSSTRLGLDRTRELLCRLGDPQRGMHFIHIAGTNGKGSTAVMTACMLTEAGYRTGFYPSPHICDFCERIEIDGRCIGKDDLARITGIVKNAADQMSDHPSQFELVTAIGMIYFKENNCDIAVLEAGMGGAMDSTNVIEAPEVCVLTNIGLDHTEYLGDTIEKIALTKSGIIKPGASVVCYDSCPEAVSVIEGVSRKNNCRFYLSSEDEIVPLKHDLYEQSFMYRGSELKMKLLGHFQLRNAGLSLKIIEALNDREYSISDSAVKNGLMNARWQARFEVLSHDPLFILDGGHNPQCAEAFAENLREYRPGEKVLLLIGMLKDKDYEKVLDIISDYAKESICITPESSRALIASDMKAEMEKRGIYSVCAGSIEEGVDMILSRARETKMPAAAFGSLYSAGTIKNYFASLKTKQDVVL